MSITTLNNQRNFCQRAILDRYKNPRHRGKTSSVHKYHECINPYCGDKVEVTIQLNQARDKIEDIKFEGKGCVISMASAELMADALHDKSIEEALKIGRQFGLMMQGQGEFSEELRRLNVMQGVTHPSRIKCATLAWHTCKAALKSTSTSELSEFSMDEKETLQLLIKNSKK